MRKSRAKTWTVSCNYGTLRTFVKRIETYLNSRQIRQDFVRLKHAYFNKPYNYVPTALYGATVLAREEGGGDWIDAAISDYK